MKTTWIATGFISLTIAGGFAFAAAQNSEAPVIQAVFDPARTKPDAIGAASSDVGYPARETD